MRSARTWPMASSAMSSATPSLDISVRAVRRRSCKQKLTPEACRRLATHLVQPARRPPVAGEGNRSLLVVTGAPVMTWRMRSVSGTSCCAPVLACSGRTTMRSAKRSRARSSWASSPRRSPVSRARRTRPPKLPRLSAACHTLRISSSLKSRPPLAAALRRSARERIGRRRPASGLAVRNPLPTHHSRNTRVNRRRSCAAPGRPTAVGLDCGDGGDELATGEVGDLLAHEPMQPAAQARERRLDVDDAAALELLAVLAAFGQEYPERGLVAHALRVQVGGG